jgi:trk system potassium uptake protein TrkH
VGLGEVSSNFRSLSDLGKWLCVIAMLLGRLEIFPLLVIATPSFWRR